jgi:type IV secretory pathway VirD2 relaxase
MSEFRIVDGFEDVWRAPSGARRKTPRTILGPKGAGGEVRARLQRIVNRVPEAIVKVTGRTRDAGHLRAHLDYISRSGDLPLEDRDGAVMAGRDAVREIGDGWSEIALADHRRRETTPFSLSVVLSMPEATDPTVVRDAVRAFAAEVFAAERDYVFALHTDTARPHLHLSVCSRGDIGARLNPKKADLALWREVFAEKLRERGVAAEATPRRARGVSLKPQRMAVRQIEARHAAGKGARGRVRAGALQNAGKAAFGDAHTPRPWEQKLVDRQARIRALYLAQAQVMIESPDGRDRRLGAKVETFVKTMPQPDSQRLILARALRRTNAILSVSRDRGDRDRGR